MAYGTIKAKKTTRGSPQQARGRFVVHRNAVLPVEPMSDDEYFPTATPPGTPFNTVVATPPVWDDDIVIPRSLIWKRAWSHQVAIVKELVSEFYTKNIGLVMVFFAQMFASIMATTTRVLETGFETKFHALQIIFVRMLCTAVIGSVWMAYKKTPGFPLGQRGVRKLLVLRSLFGTSGLFGLYYSLAYLDVADATVITFLVPSITAFVCWIAIREPFTIKEAAAGLIAFVGVLFIARPPFLVPGKKDEVTMMSVGLGIPIPDVRLQGGGLLPPVLSSPSERAIAIVCAIIGSFAAASAYATIRIIGKRAHALVSVNYFAVLATVSSFLIIMIHPDLQFEIPQTPAQWCLLVSIGLSGFLLQVLLTEGLQREKAGRATNLIYFQLVFALIIERIVWGTTPPWSSFVGSALIIASALWVSFQSKAPVRKPEEQATSGERRPLLEDDA